eukprot:Pgem_evm1s7355
MISILTLLLSTAFAFDCINAVSLSAKCNGGVCTVPKGEEWVVDSNVDLDVLHVEGKLSWDLSSDGLKLSATQIIVEDGGVFELGTKDKPMEKEATVWIKRPNGIPEHPRVGERVLAGIGSARIHIHGRELERTWTLLAQNAKPGEASITVDHNPEKMGWKIGDDIVIATTSKGDSTKHVITGIQGNRINIEPPVVHAHMGGNKDIKGFTFNVAAEVINLKRSVTITGDDDDFYNKGHGFHTVLVPLIADAANYHAEGVMDMRYTRFEKCGQWDVLARYCMHFHEIGNCPDCVLKGNSVVQSYQSGITLHGVHKALVEENVLYDNRGVGIYTEAGNEMYNVIRRNVIVSQNVKRSKIPWQGFPVKEGGIFMVGVTNDVVENRVAGMEHGLWTVGGVFGNGRQKAEGKICPQFHQFGTFKGNVFHDNERFGIYLDNQYPREVERDENGYVTNFDSCKEFKKDGSDNGVKPANKVENGLDYHNMFVGQYTLGDIKYKNYTFINNHNQMYWKRGKSMADQVSAHIEDCTFAQDETDNYGFLQLLLPGGPFTFQFKNNKFIGGPTFGIFMAPQHCGISFHNENGKPGSMCNTQYVMEGNTFHDIKYMPGVTKKVQFGISDGNPMAPMFLTKSGDQSLGNIHNSVGDLLNGFESLPGCAKDATLGGIGCDANINIRRFNIWVEGNKGDLKIEGKGYNVAPNMNEPVHGTNAGHLYYDTSGSKGYGGHMISGETYQVKGLNLNANDKIVVEFSDPTVARAMGRDPEEEFVNLNFHLSNGQQIMCKASAAESRKFRTSDRVDYSANYGVCGNMIIASYNNGMVDGTPIGDMPQLKDEFVPIYEADIPKKEPTPPQAKITTTSSVAPTQEEKDEECLNTCHTAVKGDACYGHIQWARQEGLLAYRESYKGLDENSSDAQFQTFLVAIHPNDCKLPCIPENMKCKQEEEKENGLNVEDDDNMLDLESLTIEPNATDGPVNAFNEDSSSYNLNVNVLVVLSLAVLALNF